MGLYAETRRWPALLPSLLSLHIAARWGKKCGWTSLEVVTVRVKRRTTYTCMIPVAVPYTSLNTQRFLSVVEEVCFSRWCFSLLSVFRLVVETAACRLRSPGQFLN